MKEEFTVKPVSGYLALLAALIFIGLTIAGFYYEIIWLGIASILLFFLTVKGLVIVEPNGSCVMVLFGAYKGTIRDNGFFWVNPFYTRRQVSLRARKEIGRAHV